MCSILEVDFGEQVRISPPNRSYPYQYIGGSIHLAEDDDLLLGVPVERVRIVEKIPQDLRVVCSGHDQSLLGPVVQDQLVRELAVLQRSLIAPVGVDVGDLPNLYRLLGVLLAQGEPPPPRRVRTRDPVPARASEANACPTHEDPPICDLLRELAVPSHTREEAQAGVVVATVSVSSRTDHDNGATLYDPAR